MNASRERIIEELNNLQPDEYVRIRKLTPRECGRFMGVRDDKLDKMLNSGVSNSQLYKMFGNSIVVDCLVRILGQIWWPKKSKHKRGDQLTFWDLID